MDIESIFVIALSNLNDFINSNMAIALLSDNGTTGGCVEANIAPRHK